MITIACDLGVEFQGHSEMHKTLGRPNVTTNRNAEAHGDILITDQLVFFGRV
jgi:hypothetical protein